MKENLNELKQKERIRELVSMLRNAGYAYYVKDNPVMSDKQYDDLYDELIQLEYATGYILTGSPTQRVQGEVINTLNKVEHKTPMLSADKTKDINDIVKFMKDKELVQSWKLDGLTVVAEYKEGKLFRAVTRGNGTVGEDVTHTFKHCINLPIQLNDTIDITFRGECVIPWETFNRINDGLAAPYSHPRNLASGTLRQLDSNVAINRELEYYVFEIVEGSKNDTLVDDYEYAASLGMPVVQYIPISKKEDVQRSNKLFDPTKYSIPVDGLIYKYNDLKYGKSLGTTAHHPLNLMAYKWTDDLYETVLKDVEWTIGKTGILTPTAVFNPVEIDGAIVERASLHNVSIFKSFNLHIGDTIMVYKANAIIPQVYENCNKNNRCENLFLVPDKCPICGSGTKIENENGTSVLICTNDKCSGVLLKKMCHAVSKNALNIDGLSEATLSKFISLGWIKEISDIYKLNDYRMKISNLEGFGKKSTDKLLENIEKSKNSNLERFIYSLSIPLIGHSASKSLSKLYKGNYDSFVTALNSKVNFSRQIDGFGDVMLASLYEWFNYHAKEFFELANQLNFKQTSSDNENDILNGKIFVITGSVNHFKNRDELKEVIENFGGKVSGSVSKNTYALINNDVDSNSGKNKKAKELGVNIISEDDFIKLINKESV